MGVSKQDWKDWADNFWTASGGTVEKTRAVLAAFQATIDALEAGDANRFLVLTDGESEDGLHETTNAASHDCSDAEDALQQLELKGNQKRLANSAAIAANEKAISSVSQLTYALTTLDIELVRGVTAEHEAVESDPASISKVKAELAPKLQESAETIKKCLSTAEEGVDGLLAITRIGRF